MADPSPTGDTAAETPAVWWSASRGWLLSERPRKDGYHVAEVRPGGDAVDEIEPALPDDAIPLCPPDPELARLRQELDHADHFGRGEFRVTSWAYEQVCHADRKKSEKIAALMQEVAELRAAVSSSSPDDTAPAAAGPIAQADPHAECGARIEVLEIELVELRAAASAAVPDTAQPPRLAPGDAAWLLVLVQNAVPADQDPDSPMNWEGDGRAAAYRMLAEAADVPASSSSPDDTAPAPRTWVYNFADWEEPAGVSRLIDANGFVWTRVEADGWTREGWGNLLHTWRAALSEGEALRELPSPPAAVPVTADGDTEETRRG